MRLRLKQYDKKFWAAAFTLSGTIVGAGILGLPYAFSKSGFLTSSTKVLKSRSPEDFRLLTDESFMGHDTGFKKKNRAKPF